MIKTISIHDDFQNKNANPQIYNILQMKSNISPQWRITQGVNEEKNKIKEINMQVKEMQK